MTKRVRGVLLGAALMGLASTALASTALAQKAPPTPPAWDVPADIPRVAPLAVGPAGAAEPDILRYMNVRGVGQFDLSPDGKTVAFMADFSGEPQLYTVPTTGGWPQRLTFGTGIDGAVWMPDGANFVVIADTDGNEISRFIKLSADGTSERAAVPDVKAYRYFGSFDDTGSRIIYNSTERTGTAFDIRVVDVATGTSRAVYTGGLNAFPGAWRPRSDEVLVGEIRGEDSNNLHVLNVATGAFTPLFVPKVRASFDSPVWLPDGSGFYLVSDEGREFAGLAFVDWTTKRLRYVETPNTDVTAVALTPDGQTLVWLTNEGGRSVLHARNRITGQPVTVPSLPQGVYGITMARNAPVLGIRVNGPRTPGQVFVWNIATGALTTATQPITAGLDLARFSEPQSLTFKARDGLTLQGLWYAPPARTDGAKPPVIIMVHGGPTAQARPDFDWAVQYFVARGYGVFDLNFRGSTGFGKAFARANDQRNQPLTVRDTADAAVWLAAQNMVDPKRVAVMGGSYGGYIVNAAIGEFPELFQAGVSFVGVTDWVTGLENASPQLKAADREEYGDISDPKVRAFFASISPINNVARIKSPVLVVHGRNDPRVPVAESDALVSGIRKAGGTVTYLRFEDEGHGISKVANRAYAYRRIADFLNTTFGVK
jgi:dipeptidyl aminopeptidase/acylaminoacyl peptidase